MNFSLNLVQLLERKIANREWVVDAEAVDGLVEYLGPAPRQSAAIDDSGVVVTFGLKSGVLLFLVCRALLTAKVFDGFRIWNKCDLHRMTVLASNGEWVLGVAWIGVFHEGWCSTLGEFVVYEMVLVW